MLFINTTPVSEATGDVKAMYQRQQKAFGFVPNYAKVFSHRTEVMQAWANLLVTFRRPMDEKIYELVTLAAAQAIHSSYCSLAHTRKLLGKFYSEAEMIGILRDNENNPLTTAEKAVMRLASKVAINSAQVERQDVIELQQHGFSDAEIFDIVTAAAARCFFAKVADALGAEPDAPLGEFAPELRNLLVVGRSVSEQQPEVIV